jgi:hypothetical protein
MLRSTHQFTKGFVFSSDPHETSKRSRYLEYRDEEERNVRRVISAVQYIVRDDGSILRVLAPYCVGVVLNQIPDKVVLNSNNRGSEVPLLKQENWLWKPPQKSTKSQILRYSVCVCFPMTGQEEFSTRKP